MNNSETQQNGEIIKNNQFGQLKDGKHPVYGSKNIGEIKGKDNVIFLYDYPLNIEYSFKEEAISILFVGQSGTGKSTFINAYVNYLLGITSEDNIRYKLIIGDDQKEKDQTQSQTDIITIYNVRSLRYENKLFKLIDTPGVGDTRNENNKELSKINKDKKEKEFLKMYDELFSKKIGKLNSIIFVVKASESRKTDFQKNVFYHLTNIFAADIGNNCLAILTHVDNDIIPPDGVKLLEELDIFKKKTENKEKWYFTVSSTSYFYAFKKGSRRLSVTESLFYFTEDNFIEFTNKVFSLKVYHTEKTKKNLNLKNEQENIIKKLKDNIINNLLKNIKGLKNTEIELKEKIEVCKNQQLEINKIKDQIKNQEEQKNLIQGNINQISNSKAEKEIDLKKNEDEILNLTKQKNELENNIKDLKSKQEKAQKEKDEAETRKIILQNEIELLETEIKNNKNSLKQKQNEEIKETTEMKNLQESLNQSDTSIKNLEKEIETKNEEIGKIQKLKDSKAEKEKAIEKLQDEINKKNTGEETNEIKGLRDTLDKYSKNIELLDNQIKKEEEIKNLKEKLEKSKNTYNELNNKINSENINYSTKMNELQNSLEKKKKESQELINQINAKNKEKVELENNIKSIEDSRNNLKGEIDSYKEKKKELKEKLKNDEDELNKKLNEQKNLIGLDNKSEIKINEDKNQNKMLKEIKEKIEKQINDKEKEKNKKNKIRVLEVEKDNINLICNQCQNNCHLSCRCMKILFWQPVFACKEIENSIFSDSICKVCGHLKSEHERIEKHWVDKDNPIPEEEKKILEGEILKLRECLDKIFTLEETQSSVKKKEKEIKDKEEKYKNTEEYNSKISQKKSLNELIEAKEKYKNQLLKDQQREEKSIKILESKKESDEKNKKVMDITIQTIKEELNKKEKENEKNKDKDKDLERKKKDKEEMEKNLQNTKDNLKNLKIKMREDLDNKIKEKKILEDNLKKEKDELKKADLEKEKNELLEKENKKKEEKTKMQNAQNKLDNLKKAQIEKKKNEERALQEIIDSNIDKQSNKKDELNKINLEIQTEKISSFKQDIDKTAGQKEEKELSIKKEEKNKLLNIEKIKEEEKKITEAKNNLNEKNTIISNHQKDLTNLTNVLDTVYNNDKIRLEEKKELIERELEKCKKNAIKEFLTIKLINEEIKNLTLNKDTINSVTELINELSLDNNFLKDKQFFEEIIKEYEKVIKEIDESNGHPEEIYGRYHLNPNSFKSKTEHN